MLDQQHLFNEKDQKIFDSAFEKALEKTINYNASYLLKQQLNQDVKEKKVTLTKVVSGSIDSQETTSSSYRNTLFEQKRKTIDLTEPTENKKFKH